MKKLLVTGISGFLGSYVPKYANRKWAICGVYGNKKPNMKGVELKQVDLTNRSEIRDFLHAYKADAIIHLAANSNPNACEKDASSELINVQVPSQLAAYCSAQQIPFLFASTDLVFDGLAAPYSELDTTNPIMVYGQQKKAAEETILETYPEACIARLPLMYGLPVNGLGFLNAWMGKLKKGESIPCFTDEYRTAASGADVMAGLFLLLEKRASGIYHLGGKESLSRYEFASVVVTHFGFEPDLIRPSLQKEVVMPAKRPPNVSLDSEKAYALGYRPRTLGDFLALRLP